MNKHMDVSYTIVETVLGVMVVAGGAQGVCAAVLGTAAPALESEVLQWFPSAVRQSGTGAVSVWAAELAAHVAGVGQADGMPVEMHGTAFQCRVWQTLRTIPRGQRWSYGQLAAVVGSGPRAVARACASNRIAVAIPCHRIVRSGGGLGGYRWGVARKEALLHVELTGGSSPHGAPSWT